MKSDEFGFKDNDVSSIDGVIEALHELVSGWKKKPFNSNQMKFCLFVSSISFLQLVAL